MEEARSKPVDGREVVGVEQEGVDTVLVLLLAQAERAYTAHVLLKGRVGKDVAGAVRRHRAHHAVPARHGAQTFEHFGWVRAGGLPRRRRARSRVR